MSADEIQLPVLLQLQSALLTSVCHQTLQPREHDFTTRPEKDQALLYNPELRLIVCILSRRKTSEFCQKSKILIVYKHPRGSIMQFQFYFQKFQRETFVSHIRSLQKMKSVVVYDVLPYYSTSRIHLASYVTVS